MKTLFILNKDNDIRMLQNHQINNLYNQNDDNKITFIDCNENLKIDFLNLLDSINDDTILFFPINTLLYNIDKNKIRELSEILINNKDDIEYIRLRKIGNSRNLKYSENLFKDHSNMMYLTPHIVKTITFKNIISKIKTKNELFWHSLETRKIKGLYYFDILNDQTKKEDKSIGWVCNICNAHCGILHPTGKWDGQFLQNDVAKKLLSEYNINTEERGIDIAGCCA